MSPRAPSCSSHSPQGAGRGVWGGSGGTPPTGPWASAALSRPSPCPCPPAPCCPQALCHPAPRGTPAGPHHVWTPTAVWGVPSRWKRETSPPGATGGTLCPVRAPSGSSWRLGQGTWWQGGDSQHGSTKGKPCLTSLVTTEGPCGQIEEEQLVSCLDVCKALGRTRLGRDEVNGWAVTWMWSWPHGSVHGATALAQCPVETSNGQCPYWDQHCSTSLLMTQWDCAPPRQLCGWHQAAWCC